MDNSPPFLFPLTHTSHFSDLFPKYPVVWSLLEKRFVLGSGKAVGDFCGGLQATQVPGEQG